ncbi:MAG: spore coat-associated protein [Euryarchaeota archaeon]|nr:spore coat-associated protein [Euryarchaeota archaeon]
MNFTQKRTLKRKWNMGKKNLSIMVLIALLALTIGIGAYAAFNDIETARANDFTAGTLNLQVGSADPCIEKINIGSADLKPGASETAGTWLVQNTGNIAGNLNIQIIDLENSENTRYDMEADAGDLTEEAGELGANLKVAFWMDVDKSNTWSPDDYYLNSTGSKVPYDSESALPAEAYDTLDNYDDEIWSYVNTPLDGSEEAGYFKIEYELPGDTGNIVQSDISTFNISFTLEQAI